MSLKTVFFDFGGTIDLYPEIQNDTLAAMEKILVLLRDNGIDVPADMTSETFFKHLDRKSKLYKLWRKKTLVEISTMELWNDYILQGLCQEKIVDSNFSEELTYIVETGRYTRSVRPEMKSVMEQLINTTSLNYGIISNIISKSQVPKSLKKYNLEQYFSKLILSAEFGKVKPDASIFHHAAAQYLCRPEECMYVGNSPSKDVDGARNAGFLATVQIEYKDDSEDTTDPGGAPDYYIKTMEELPEIINSLLKV
jgi:putative hydrolase of the HAD superfamily